MNRVPIVFLPSAHARGQFRNLNNVGCRKVVCGEGDRVLASSRRALTLAVALLIVFSLPLFQHVLPIYATGSRVSPLTCGPVQYYLNVVSPYDTPSGEGWYISDTDAYASLTNGVVNHGNGTRNVFVEWSGDASGANYSKSNAIVMNQNMTAVADWKTQYLLNFSQTGLDDTATGTVVTINGVSESFETLPFSTWVDNGTVVTYSYGNVSSITSGKRFVLTGVTGPPSPITVTSPVTVTGNYKTQYYLTVSSPYGSPSPSSGWFDAGASVTASVTSPWSGPTGTRYLCTGWTGTGSVPTSGTATTATFTMNQPSSITWNWKTQYYLTVGTSPSGITTIPGQGWYNESASVTLTAPTVPKYQFNNWDVDGTSQGSGVNPITVHMDGPHTATAHYSSAAVVPVGGYAIPLNRPVATSPLICYTMLVAVFGAAITLIKRKRK
jgi:hypothetical protein